MAEIEIIFSFYLCLIKKIIRLLHSNTKAITSMSLVLVKQLLRRLDSRKSNFGKKSEAKGPFSCTPRGDLI